MRVLTLLLLSALSTASLFAAFPSKDVILPAVGRVSGANGAEFYTDLYVTNPSPADGVSFNLQFLVAGQANPSPLTIMDHLGPGQSKSYANIGETLFHLKGVLGALRVTSDRELQINSRIYNRPDGSVAAETVGAGFAGVPSDFGTGRGESSVLQGIRVDGDFRYNIFLTESAGQPVTLTLHLIDDHGSELKSAAYQLLGYEQKLVAVSELVPNVNVSGAIVRVDVTGGSGRVVAAGAQVANRSQDTSSFEMAFSESRLSLLASPAVTHLNGLTNDVTLQAGNNVTITPSGNTLRIDAAGGTSGITSVSAGAGLAGGGATGNVLLAVAPSGITTPLLADGAVTDTKVASVSYAKITGAPASLPPNGSAGGALAGTYPSPTLNTTGATTQGQALTFNGTSAVWSFPTASSLLMPFAATANLASTMFSLTNNGSGTTLAIHQNSQSTGLTVVGPTGPLLSPLVDVNVTPSTGSQVLGLNVRGNDATGIQTDVSSANGYALHAVNLKGVAISALSSTASGGAIVAENDGFAATLLATKVGPNTGTVAQVENHSTSNTFPALLVTTASTGLAAQFTGDVQVSGNISKGGGSFKIDHPLDPQNKYLYHSFVESPDMKNIYDGVVTTDAQGRAVVELPDWFDALNRDFRYQLTAIGAAAPGLYVAKKIEGNRFEIAGALPNMEVSWQVTGVRHDAYANRHRIPVEEVKEPENRGRYLHPEAFGEH